jgi:hypothetical protein
MIAVFRADDHVADRHRGQRADRGHEAAGVLDRALAIGDQHRVGPIATRLLAVTPALVGSTCSYR